MMRTLAWSTLLSSAALIAGCSSPDTAPASSAGGGGGVSGAGVAGSGAQQGGTGLTSAGSAGTSAQGGDVSSRGGAGSSGQGSRGGSSSSGNSGGGVSGQGGDARVVGSAGSAGAGAEAGTGGLPPLTECTSQPSIDRLTQWTASGEGATVPATGSILVQEGSGYVGKVQFVGAEWHVIPVLIANQFDVSADLSSATGFTLTYSATAELHVQLRSKSHWSGGDQYATTIPSTAGQKETHFFSFAAEGWKSLFGQPVLAYADTLKEAMGLVFVGNSENSVTFYGLRIDGYTPACQ